jgi:hypothetical protein
MHRARAGDLTHELTKLVLLNPDLMSDLGDGKSACRHVGVASAANRRSDFVLRPMPSTFGMQKPAQSHRGPIWRNFAVAAVGRLMGQDCDHR